MIKKISIAQQGLYICADFKFWKITEFAFYVQVSENNNFDLREKRNTAKQFSHYIASKERTDLIIENVGDDVWLKCKTSKNLKSNITWYKNNIEDLGAKRSQKWNLLLKNLTRDDTGNYTCVVWNGTEYVNHTFRLLVLGK